MLNGNSALNGAPGKNGDLRSSNRDEILSSMHLLAKDKCDAMLAGDPVMDSLVFHIHNYRDSGLLMTLVGEPGVGKENLAKLTHHSSKKGGEFSAVNIAGLPENLLESELFGHRKGAFSGAHVNRHGRFHTIREKGTLLLDEVGDLSPVKQAMLLRATADEPTFTPVGENEEIKVGGRIMCATNANLEVLERTGRFRRDLRHRLEACLFHVPPLRERSEKHQVNVMEYLIKQIAAKHDVPDLQLSQAAIDLLLNSPVEGNIRGVKSLLVRSAFDAKSRREAVITPDMLTAHLSASKVLVSGPGEIRIDVAALNVPKEQLRRAVIEAAERQLIENTLESFGGNVSRTAEELGMHRSNLCRSIKKMGIQPKRVTTEEKTS